MSEIEERVCAIIHRRAARGEEKYGVTMEREDLDVFQWIDHAQQEMLDAAVYLEKLKDVLQFLSPNKPGVKVNDD